MDDWNRLGEFNDLNGPRTRSGGLNPSIRLRASFLNGLNLIFANILDLVIAPEDHVAAYVLLASFQSKTMTGAVIHTDAGRGVTTFNRE